MTNDKIKSELNRLLISFKVYLDLPDELNSWLTENAYFAGGCIYSLANDETPKDYDIFLKNISRIDEIKELTNPQFKTNYALTYNVKTLSGKTIKFQIITKYHGEPMKCVSEFDFMHNMYYYDIATRELVSVNNEWASLHIKRLQLNSNRARDLEGVFLRVSKYLSRGFTHCDEVAKEVLSLTTWDKINEYRTEKRKELHGEHY